MENELERGSRGRRTPDGRPRRGFRGVAATRPRTIQPGPAAAPRPLYVRAKRRGEGRAWRGINGGAGASAGRGVRIAAPELQISTQNRFTSSATARVQRADDLGLEEPRLDRKGPV